MKFRPRFSLRTLFVLVAIVGGGTGWVAYQSNWTRQRSEFGHRNDVGQVEPGFPVQAPWSLRLLGEVVARSRLAIPESELEQAKRLFPEATLYRNTDMKVLYSPAN